MSTYQAFECTNTLVRTEKGNPKNSSENNRGKALKKAAMVSQYW